MEPAVSAWNQNWRIGVPLISSLWRRAPCKYVRPSGSLCYEAPLRSDSAALIEALSVTTLSWIWNAWPASQVASESPNDFRRVLADTLPDLAHELTAQDEPYSHLFGILLLGGRDLGSITLGQEDIRRAVQLFSTGHSGPLEVAIVDPGDTPYLYIFVQPESSAPVSQLLSKWGVMTRQYEICKYEALRTIALERFFGLPT